MLQGMIGRKVGMTQLFDERGQVIPVTVLRRPALASWSRRRPPRRRAIPHFSWVLSSAKTRFRRLTLGVKGHLRKAGSPRTRILREFAYEETEGTTLKVGDEVLAHQVFQADDTVNVVGTSKGRGFQGVIKRHGFGGGRATHGSMFHRAPGSIGQSASPSRVFPGTRGPGRMGNKRVTIRNLQVVQVDEENHLLLVKGSVPGSRAHYLNIVRSGRRN